MQDDAQRSLELADDDIKHAQDQIEKYRNEAMALRVRYFMFSILGKNFSGQYFEIFLSFFPEKNFLEFHSDCLLETICMKCYNFFF